MFSTPLHGVPFDIDFFVLLCSIWVRIYIFYKIIGHTTGPRSFVDLQHNWGSTMGGKSNRFIQLLSLCSLVGTTFIIKIWTNCWFSRCYEPHLQQWYVIYNCNYLYRRVNPNGIYVQSISKRKVYCLRFIIRYWYPRFERIVIWFAESSRKPCLIRIRRLDRRTRL